MKNLIRFGKLFVLSAFAGIVVGLCCNCPFKYYVIVLFVSASFSFSPYINRINAIVLYRIQKRYNSKIYGYTGAFSVVYRYKNIRLIRFRKEEDNGGRKSIDTAYSLNVFYKNRWRFLRYNEKIGGCIVTGKQIGRAHV